MSSVQTMKSPGLLRIFFIASISSLLISYLALWVRFINDPVERTGSDFIAFYITGFMLLSRLLKDAGVDSRMTQLAGIGSFLFLPLFFSLMNGQDTAFLFLGAAIWMYGLFSGKETVAGLGLSLTTIRPHIALILALPMLFSHRKVFWGVVLGAGLLAVFSLSF